jgi:hypothetical protein
MEDYGRLDRAGFFWNDCDGWGGVCVDVMDLSFLIAPPSFSWFGFFAIYPNRVGADATAGGCDQQHRDGETRNNAITPHIVL